MKKSTKQIVIKPQKICNSCGEMAGAYEVFENGIICNDCCDNYFPQLNLEIKPKKIPNENQMLTKILEKK